MTVHVHNFTPEQLKTLHYLRAVLPVSSAIRRTPIAQPSADGDSA